MRSLCRGPEGWPECGGDHLRTGSQGCQYPVLPLPCLHGLDEAAVAVHLDTSSRFTSAVSHAGRLNIGLCGKDMALEGSSKQVASEEFSELGLPVKVCFHRLLFGFRNDPGQQSLQDPALFSSASSS